MPRPRTHGERTRRALLDTAAELLATGGLDAVSVRRVADASGTTTRAVYSLFGSKEGLLLGLYHEGFAALRERTEAVPVTADPLADIHALGRAYRASAIENRHRYDLMFHRQPGWEPSPEERRASRRTLRPLGDAVARAVAAGRLEHDVPGTTLRLWALVHGLASLELTGDLGDPERAAAHWERAVSAALGGAGPA